MTNSSKNATKAMGGDPTPHSATEISSVNRKGPLSFLSGALTSGILAWLCFRLSDAMVSYFALHSSNYSSAIAQSIASGFKTLIIGTCFLATFTFSFIGLGLTLVFFRSCFISKEADGN